MESVEGIKTHIQYMYPKNQKILFPNVGKINGDNINNKKFHLTDEGLVANEDFDTVEISPKTITYALESSNEMHQAYPFPFHLEVTYKVRSFHINVFYTIKNTGITPMQCHIGHELFFNAPPFIEIDSRGTLNFKHSTPLNILNTDEDGFISRRHGSLHMVNDGAELAYSNTKIHSFYIDDHQTKSVALYDVYNRPYLSVEAPTPVYHVASDMKLDEPYVAISPYWGIGDRDNFTGKLNERPYIITIPKGKLVTLEYVIQFNAENSYFVGRPGFRNKRTLPIDTK